VSILAVEIAADMTFFAAHLDIRKHVWPASPPGYVVAQFQPPSRSAIYAAPVPVHSLLA